MGGGRVYSFIFLLLDEQPLQFPDGIMAMDVMIDLECGGGRVAGLVWQEGGGPN